MDNNNNLQIVRKLTVDGHKITSDHVRSVIDGLANVPMKFESSDLIRSLNMPDLTYHDHQEIMNRLCQRWRKMGLMEYKNKRWTLTRGAWDKLQTAVAQTR